MATGLGTGLGAGAMGTHLGLAALGLALTADLRDAFGQSLCCELIAFVLCFSSGRLCPFEVAACGLQFVLVFTLEYINALPIVAFVQRLECGVAILCPRNFDQPSCGGSDLT